MTEKINQAPANGTLSEPSSAPQGLNALEASLLAEVTSMLFEVANSYTQTQAAVTRADAEQSDEIYQEGQEEADVSASMAQSIQENTSKAAPSEGDVAVAMAIAARA